MKFLRKWSHVDVSGLHVKASENISPAYKLKPAHPSSPSAKPSPKPRPFFPHAKVISVFVKLRPSRTLFQPSVGIWSSPSQVYFLVESTGLYFLRRTAVLILRPAIVCCPAGEAVKDLVDPILNVGGCEKLNAPPGAPAWGAMEGLAGGAGDAADPAPKVNTPELLFEGPNPLAPPN